MSSMDSWENWYLDPDSVLGKVECPCTECENPAEYEINGEWYCEHCIDQFRSVKGDNNVCSECGEEIDEGYYLINGEIFCDDCFTDIFRK